MTETELVSLAELFKKKEYVEKLEGNKTQLRMPDIIDRPIIITGYGLDTLIGSKSGKEEECFKMSFYFADDDRKTPHFVRSQATRIWEYLRAVNDANPELLNSGTVVTSVCKGKLQGKFGTEYYYFAGTE